MRKILSSIMLIAVAAMAFVSCQKEETSAPETVSATLTLNANVEQTKTYLDENNAVLWGKGEAVTLYVGAGETAKFFDSASTDAYDGEASASFTFEIKEVTDADTYALGGIYPASAAKGINNNNNPKSFKIELPATQDPEVGKYDPSAYIMVLKPETVETLPTEYQASFRRATALNKITLTDVKEDITTVEITVPTTKFWAGRRYFDLTTGESGEVYENGGRTNTIKVNSTYGAGTIEVWFTSWGVDLASGEELTIKMTSAAKTYTRTIKANEKGIKFIEGRLNELSINMSHKDVVEETLDNLSGEYLIAAMPESWVLMSENVHSNGYYTSTITNVTTSASEVKATEFYDVENIENHIWTVTKVDGGYSVKNNATGKYLKLGKDGNNAYSSDDVVVFDIAVTDMVAVITDKTYTTRELEYNSSNPRFAFYKNTQKDIYFIPWVEDSTPRISVSENAVEVEADATSVMFTYTLHNVTGIPDVTVADGATMSNVIASAYDGTVTVEFDANEEGVEKSATLVLSINGAEDVEVVLTQKKWVDPNEVKELTIADFLKEEVNPEVFYKLSGTIANLTNMEYGNFYLVDETASVYVYGLKENETATNTSFSKLGLKEGDYVTLIGPRSDYQGTAQVGTSTVKAYYVSHIPSCVAPVIACTDNIVTITAEEGATIYYTTNGDIPTELSTEYTREFSITEDTTVKAIAVATGKVKSVVTEKSCTYVDPNAGGGEEIVIFKESFGNNPDKARVWNDSYKEQSGIDAVYSASTYTMTNLKQGKYSTGHVNSGINQSSSATPAYFEVKNLNVQGYSNFKVSYYWKAGSIKGTYYTKLYYSTDGGNTYVEVEKDSGIGATSFVEVKYTLPSDIITSSLSLKVEFSTSNTQAVIDEFVLSATN